MPYTLDYYKSMLVDINNKIKQRKKKNENIQAEINRLQNAYDKLKKLKNEHISPMQSKVKLKNCFGTLAWRGHKKDMFDKYMDSNVKDGAAGFNKKIDNAMDELNKAIRDKKNKIDTGVGILNSLKNKYNDVSTTIKNWFN